jgi:small subunit ribosomal protein S8
MINYQIGDFLVRIKNAVLAQNREVEAVLTKQNLAVAQTLKRAGYLEEVSVKKGKLTVKLAFSHKKPVLTNLKLVSKPGQRIYLSAKEIIRKKGPSLYLVNTPLGVLTSREAVKKQTGGEVISEVF